jgi:hypothetical protein
MSDDKLNALDNRVTELVTITGRLVGTVTGLGEQQNKFAEEQKRLAEEQKITSGRLDDALRIILEQGQQQKEFAEEQKRFAEEQKRFAEEQKRLAEEQKRLAEEQKILNEEQRKTSERLDKMIDVLIEQTKQQEQFRKETNENFASLRVENKVINRKVEWATTTSLDADKRVEVLEMRVAKLEEKIAA